MRASEYFAWVRSRVIELRRMEAAAVRLSESCRMGGKASGTFDAGRRMGGSRTSVADRLIDMEDELELARRELERELSRATDVLYGQSGKGGVALARGSAAADSVCGYYLQAMTWRQVADELVKPESDNAAMWCRACAKRALEYVDAVGMASLADT